LFYGLLALIKKLFFMVKGKKKDLVKVAKKCRQICWRKTKVFHRYLIFHARCCTDKNDSNKCTKNILYGVHLANYIKVDCITALGDQ
jgi:hypothetical protein